LDKKKCLNKDLITHYLRLPPYDVQPTLELDEVWSFVQAKVNKKWVWLAYCRETQQIVGRAIGDRGEEGCKALWESIPEYYKHSFCYTDFWEAYGKVLDPEQHKACGKDEGETNHMERWNNTLRQRLSRFVRKSLSFSKDEAMHQNCLDLFIAYYNKEKGAIFDESMWY
jgi:insertion element IS1 protein InsB